MRVTQKDITAKVTRINRQLVKRGYTTILNDEWLYGQPIIHQMRIGSTCVERELSLRDKPAVIRQWLDGFESALQYSD